MVALTPGMGDADEMPILADQPTPAQVARRLQLLADALRPWKINAGVTAVDLMLQTRTKAWSPREWRDVVFAPSTTAPPFGIGDVRRLQLVRPPTRQESERRYVHAYDRGGSYVVASRTWSSRSATRSTIRRRAIVNPKTPGYWLVDIPERGNGKCHTC